MHILNISLYISLFFVSQSLWCGESLPKQVAQLSQSAPPATPPKSIPRDGFHGLEKKYTRSVGDFEELAEQQDNKTKVNGSELQFDFEMEMEED